MAPPTDTATSEQQRLDERRPLLRSWSSRRAGSQSDNYNGFAPIRRYSSQGQTGHWLVPDPEALAAPDQNEDAVEETDLTSPSSLYNGMSRTKFWIIMGVIFSQYFLATFDSTLMASSHPVITSYFNASNAASWLSTAFLLTSTSFQPLFGRLSDTFGRRPLYLFSLATFALTTGWCVLAQSIGSFIAARAFCGLGAGGVMSMVRDKSHPLAH